MKWWLSLTLLVASAGAQQSPVSAPQSLTFDVATIKVNPTTSGRSHIWSDAHDGNFRTENVTLKQLLQFAWNLPETQILDVPSALADKKFDIVAKSDDATNAELHSLSSDEGKLRKQQMLQALFAERFHLTCHKETRELPVYDLVVAKTGSKLIPSKDGNRLFNTSYGKFQLLGITPDGLARELAKVAGRVVVDKTGIDGSFDVLLRWTPDQGPAMVNGAPIADPPPDLFTAIQEQLGLKLEPGKGPVEVLVIDHVEMPTEN